MIIHVHYVLKGTVSRDFRPSVFLKIKTSVLGPWLRPPLAKAFSNVNSNFPKCRRCQSVIDKLNNIEKWKSYAKRRCYAKKIKNACGVIDTGCMVHIVSLTRHAKYDTAWLHNPRTIRAALAGFKGKIYQKHYPVEDNLERC
jgi:hypothetical protein